MLKIIHQRNHNPYFNIATEEYLLKSQTDDFFIIYRNAPSLIVGKHQNTNAEINHQFVESNGVSVVRRLSGGGTVYHDLGNINFSFIVSGAEGQLVDFKKFTRPIIEILQGFGVEAYLGGKNDIRVGDRKISGNAEHVYKNRVLHHGTLLFESELEKLNEAIRVDLTKYHDNSVKSIRSVVANINEFLPVPMSVEYFEEVLLGYMLSYFPDSEEYSLSASDIQAIENLVKTKYSTWEWNYGYSPTYEVCNSIATGLGPVCVKIKVDKGLVDDLSFDNECISEPIVQKLRSRLIGQKHELDIVALCIDDKEIGDFFQNHLSVKLIPEYFC